MITYNINIGTDIEASSLNLADITEFQNILNRLEDNLSGEIDPRDVRDAVLSVWSNAIIKETTNGSEYYIGIDTSNPNDGDLKMKILIGKRESENIVTFTDDMNSQSAPDIYFYDTKNDSEINGETKISILSGQDKDKFLNAPFISSNRVITDLYTEIVDLYSETTQFEWDDFGGLATSSVVLNGVFLCSGDVGLDIIFKGDFDLVGLENTQLIGPDESTVITELISDLPCLETTISATVSENLWNLWVNTYGVNLTFKVSANTNVDNGECSGEFIKIKASIPEGDFQQLTFNFVNELGDINLLSENGDISLGEIKFPRIIELDGSDINNKILKYDNGKLIFDVFSYQVDGDLGTTDETLDLNGALTLNDYSLEFTDNRMVPINLNDISLGDTFNNYPLSEILKRIVYSYQSPSGSLSFLKPENGYIEVGITSPEIEIEFTINKKTLPTLVTVIENTAIGSYPPITDSSFKTIKSSTTGLIYPAPPIQGIQNYKMILNDGTETSFVNLDLNIVYPIFWGIGVNNSSTYTNMMFLLKLTEGKSTKVLSYLGTGNIYFLYPIEYGLLTEILDNNSNNIISNFEYVIYNYSSPDGFWASKPYYIWKSNYTTTHTSPKSYIFVF